MDFKEKRYQGMFKGITVIVAADIGGTNSNFGVFTMEEDVPLLLLSLHFKSQKITRFTDVVRQVLIYLNATYGMTVDKMVIAAAGVILKNRTFTKPTNLAITIDTQEIKRETGLQCIALANDFEIIGYGLDFIAPEALVNVNQGVGVPYANKAILGAGTGLGKCILLWHDELDRYVPVPSEGGHADLAGQTPLDFDLITYAQQERSYSCPLSWEDVLAGKGIQLLYDFFSYKNQDKESHEYITNNGFHPDEIFNNRTLDAHSAKTFELYSRYYARCAKNFSLDALALGGLYIAGGIAAKNLPLFKQDCFMQEFLACNKQADLLRRIPIYVITDYNVSLYGAAVYLRDEKICSS